MFSSVNFAAFQPTLMTPLISWRITQLWHFVINLIYILSLTFDKALNVLHVKKNNRLAGAVAFPQPNLFNTVSYWVLI